MDTISKEELEVLLDTNFINSPTKPFLLFLDAEGCHACEVFYGKVLDSDNLGLLSEIVDLKRLIVTGRPPTFAPPVYPSVIGFLGGVRFWEGLGDPDTPDTLIESVIDWVSNQDTDRLSISEGYRSI